MDKITTCRAKYRDMNDWYCDFHTRYGIAVDHTVLKKSYDLVFTPNSVKSKTYHCADCGHVKLKVAYMLIVVLISLQCVRKL